jgi:hypothetical protein
MHSAQRPARLRAVVVTLGLFLGTLLGVGEAAADFKVAHWNILHGWVAYWGAAKSSSELGECAYHIQPGWEGGSCLNSAWQDGERPTQTMLQQQLGPTHDPAVIALGLRRSTAASAPTRATRRRSTST